MTTSVGALRRLQAISTFHHFALEAAEIGIWEWYVVRREATYIENCLELLRLGSEELRAQYRGLSSDEWANRIHPDDGGAHDLMFEHFQLEGQGGVRDVDHRMPHVDGSYRWFNTRGKVVEQDGEGHPLRMASIMRDIHLRKTFARGRGSVPWHI